MSSDDAHRLRPSHGPFAVAGLTIVLWLEVALMAIVTVVLIADLAVKQPTSYASAVAILVLSLIATVWLIFAALAAPRRRSWVRAAAITWQILQGAAAAGAVVDSGRPVLSWIVLLISVAGLFFALTIRDGSRTGPEESAGP